MATADPFLIIAGGEMKQKRERIVLKIYKFIVFLWMYECGFACHLFVQCVFHLYWNRLLLLASSPFLFVCSDRNQSFIHSEWCTKREHQTRWNREWFTKFMRQIKKKLNLLRFVNWGMQQIYFIKIQVINWHLFIKDETKCAFQSYKKDMNFVWD